MKLFKLIVIYLAFGFASCGTQKPFFVANDAAQHDTIVTKVFHYFPDGMPVGVPGIPIDTTPVVVVPPDDTTPIIEPPSDGLKLYFTADPGVTDFMFEINTGDKKLPRGLRTYWLQDKENPPNTVPADVEYITPPKKYDKTLPWRVYSNFIRMRGARDAIDSQGETDVIMISTENIFGPNGIIYGFPNKNWPTNAWGRTPEAAKAKIKEWARAFIDGNNNYIGVGSWVWQFSSEPWDIDWQFVQAAYYEAWLETPVELRPKLASAALPIGQGETTEEGTNKWFDGELTDFIPEYMRKDISIVCVHAYALDNLKWVDDPSIATDIIQRALDFTAEYLPHANVQVTEFGYPGTDQETQYNHLKAIIDWCKTKPRINKMYAFNLIQINSNDIFNDCFFTYKDRNKPPRKAYSLFSVN